MTTGTLSKKWFAFCALAILAQAPTIQAAWEKPDWVKNLQQSLEAAAGKAQEKAGKLYDATKNGAAYVGQKLGREALAKDTEATIATSSVGKCVGYCQARFEGLVRYVKNHKAGCVITAIVGVAAVYAVYKSIKYVAKKASAKTAPASDVQKKAIADDTAKS